MSESSCGLTECAGKPMCPQCLYWATPTTTMTPEECKLMDHAMLEDKLNDGYFKRACASALLQQVRWQNMSGTYA